MIGLDLLDKRFVSAAADPSRRAAMISRLTGLRMIMLLLLVAIFLFSLFGKKDWRDIEIQNSRLFLALLVLSMYNKIDSSIRLLKIIEIISNSNSARG